MPSTTPAGTISHTARGAVELGHEVGPGRRPRGALGGHRLHGVGEQVVDDALVPGPHQAPHHVGAHPAQPNHAQLHRGSPLLRRAAFLTTFDRRRTGTYPRSMDSGTEPGVLAGIKVVDFGRYVAGPWCAALLGDLGADVVRVERVEGGEDRFVAPVAGDEGGAIFLQVNRGKRGLTLDTSTEAGQEVVRRLLESADIVVANLPPKARRSMGIDWPQVQAANPRAILVSATTFGAGPNGDRLGFDGIAQVMSGAVHLSGVPGQPTKAYVPWVDFGTAHLLAFAAMAALLARERTGVGQHVDGALMKTALTVANSPIIEQAVLGLDRVATLNRGQTSGPYDIFDTADGHVIVMVIGGRQFDRWCRIVGADELRDDPRFADDRGRGLHGAALSERMAAWCAGRSTAEVLAALESRGHPGRPGLLAAGRTRRRLDRRLPGAARLPRCTGGGPGQRLPGRPLGHAGPDPRPGAPARRAHRRRPGRARLPRRPHRRPPGRRHRLSSVRDVSAPCQSCSERPDEQPSTLS